VNTYTIYWLSGQKEVVKGNTFTVAFAAAGYGGGAIRAVDFYEVGTHN